MILDIPDSVRAYLKKVFNEVDNRVSTKISSTPNTPEEALDICFIESLTKFAGPQVVDANWAVRLSAHFIGSLRHYRRYEIADIGVVVVFKKGNNVVGRKLILLQSKRLYPSNHRVTEFDELDYQLGLGLVTRSDDHEIPIFSTVEYEFNAGCVYGALRANSDQCQAIQAHFEATDIPVHYLFYNPLVLPWSFSYPIEDEDLELPPRTFGTRILEASKVHSAMNDFAGFRQLKLTDITKTSGDGVESFGWDLASFFDEVITCREGYRFSGEKDAGLRRLFERKSGPIYSIVEITIESKA